MDLGSPQTCVNCKWWAKRCSMLISEEIYDIVSIIEAERKEHPPWTETKSNGEMPLLKPYVWILDKDAVDWPDDCLRAKDPGKGFTLEDKWCTEWRAYRELEEDEDEDETCMSCAWWKYAKLALPSTLYSMIEAIEDERAQTDA